MQPQTPHPALAHLPPDHQAAVEAAGVDPDKLATMDPAAILALVQGILSIVAHFRHKPTTP